MHDKNAQLRAQKPQRKMKLGFVTVGNQKKTMMGLM